MDVALTLYFCGKANRLFSCRMVKILLWHHYPQSHTINGAPSPSMVHTCIVCSTAHCTLLTSCSLEENYVYVTPDHSSTAASCLCSPDRVSNVKSLSWLILCHLFLLTALKIPQRLWCKSAVVMQRSDREEDDITENTEFTVSGWSVCHWHCHSASFIFLFWIPLFNQERLRIMELNILHNMSVFLTLYIVHNRNRVRIPRWSYRIFPVDG